MFVRRKGRSGVQVTTAIAAATFADFPYDETVPSILVNAASSVGSIGTLLLVEAPNREQAITVAKIRVYIAATSGNIDVGVWTFDGTTWTLVGSSGSTPAGTLNSVQVLTVSGTPPVIPAGTRRCYGVTADNTTVTFGRPAAPTAAITFDRLRNASKATSFPLATNASSFVAAALAANGVLPWVVGSPT